MDDLQTKSIPAQPDVAEIQAGYEALRNLVFSILVLLVVVSGTFTIYLWRLVRYASRDLESIRGQATQMIEQYQKTSGPMMDNFIKQIAEYGRTHPDFAPIMTKYGIKPTIAPAATPTPGAQPPGSAAPNK
jgi:hypothetical protein